IHSEEYARPMSRATNGFLLTAADYSKNEDGRHMVAFSKLRADDAIPLEGFNRTPASFQVSFMQLFRSEIDSVIRGTKTVEEALITIQNNGQTELEQATTAQN